MAIDKIEHFYECSVKGNKKLTDTILAETREAAEAKYRKMYQITRESSVDVILFHAVS